MRGFSTTTGPRVWTTGKGTSPSLRPLFISVDLYFYMETLLLFLRDGCKNELICYWLSLSFLVSFCFFTFWYKLFWPNLSCFATSFMTSDPLRRCWPPLETFKFCWGASVDSTFFCCFWVSFYSISFPSLPLPNIPPNQEDYILRGA